MISFLLYSFSFLCCDDDWPVVKNDKLSLNKMLTLLILFCVTEF